MQCSAATLLPLYPTTRSFLIAKLVQLRTRNGPCDGEGGFRESCYG